MRFFVLAFRDEFVDSARILGSFDSPFDASDSAKIADREVDDGGRPLWRLVLVTSSRAYLDLK